MAGGGGRRLAGVALPVAAALLASGAVLLAVGVDPLAYYGIVVRHGLLTPLGLAETPFARRRCRGWPPA